MMNRQQRRRLAAEQRKGPVWMPPAREDGRPLYFDIGGADSVVCYYCQRNGLTVTHKLGEAVMNDPANPVQGQPQGSMHTICIHHLPDNAVIYNPRTNFCRTKSGDAWWEEGKREDIPEELRKVL